MKAEHCNVGYMNLSVRVLNQHQANVFEIGCMTSTCIYIYTITIAWPWALMVDNYKVSNSGIRFVCLTFITFQFFLPPNASLSVCTAFTFSLLVAQLFFSSDLFPAINCRLVTNFANKGTATVLYKHVVTVLIQLAPQLCLSTDHLMTIYIHSVQVPWCMHG